MWGGSAKNITRGLGKFGVLGIWLGSEAVTGAWEPPKGRVGLFCWQWASFM